MFRPQEYFYLYRVSYLYYIVISFTVTIAVGLVVSWVATLWSKHKQSTTNPDLFTPPVAHYVRRKQCLAEMVGVIQ